MLGQELERGSIDVYSLVGKSRFNRCYRTVLTYAHSQWSTGSCRHLDQSHSVLVTSDEEEKGKSTS